MGVEVGEGCRSAATCAPGSGQAPVEQAALGQQGGGGAEGQGPVLGPELCPLVRPGVLVDPREL